MNTDGLNTAATPDTQTAPEQPVVEAQVPAPAPVEAPPPPRRSGPG